MGMYNSETIQEAMDNIVKHKYLLPALQRKFVWSTDQIEMLFDSLMQKYPINSFMLWAVENVADNVVKDKVTENLKFYDFLKDYCERFHEDNEEVSTSAIKGSFYAVVDGQQRLNSLYIGLCGSYRYKKPNKHWLDTQDALPTRRLYLDLLNPINAGIDNEKKYNFSFLTDAEAKNEIGYHWFKVGDILNQDVAYVNKYLLVNKLQDNTFALDTLSKLYSAINKDEVINYCVIKRDRLDDVLEVFLRTNSGGTALTFSDLLMSICVSNWKNYDAREEMTEIRKEIRQYGNPNFDVSQDLILKSMLTLADLDVKFKTQDFSQNIDKIEGEWDNIKKSLVFTFRLLEKLGFNNDSIKAKNATIPVAYYIYTRKLYDKEKILKEACKDDRAKIRHWLILTLLKGIFGGNSDSVLTAIREVLKENKTNDFPEEAIIDRFKSNPNKNYTFTVDIIDSWMGEQYQSPIASLILMLLYPEVVEKNGGAVAQDHMHPKVIFSDKKKLQSLKLSNNDYAFYSKKENYNALPNLQLLSRADNNKKLDMPLDKWATNNGITEKDLYLDNGVSLDIYNFKNFLEVRKKNIKEELKQIIKIS